MKNVNLMQKIDTFLQEEEINFAEAAAALGKHALIPLKKIIASKDPRAEKAIELEKNIKLLVSGKKKTQSKGGQFSTSMRSISSNSPDGHIKSFGADMKSRRGRS